MQAGRRRQLLVATVGFDLGGAEAQGHAADADVVLAGRQSDDGRLPVVPDLSGDLAGGAYASVAAAPAGGDAVPIASYDLQGGTLLGGALLRDQAGILILGAIAPDRCFLFPQKSNISGALGRCLGAARAA